MLEKWINARFCSLFLSILLVSATLVGCGGKSKGNEEVGKTKVENDNTTKEDEKTNSNSDYDELIDLGLPPVSVGLTKFLEAKGNSYEMLDGMLESIEADGNFMAGLAILPLYMADLTILPLTMIGTLPSKGKNLWEGNLFMLFEGTGIVEMKGDISTFTMEIEAAENANDKMTINGEYDSNKDSLQAIFTVDGKETVIFEFAASGNGYASQIYSKNEDSFSLIKNAFDENRLYSGLITEGGKPESIYQKKVDNWEQFVKNDTLMIVLDKGKGYSIIDGEKYEHK